VWRFLFTTGTASTVLGLLLAVTLTYSQGGERLTELRVCSVGTVTTECTYLADGIDDQVQWQDAIDHCALTGCTIWATDGVYSISWPIDLKSGVAIRGQSPMSTLFRLAPRTNKPIFSTTSSTDLMGVELRDFRADGNRAENPDDVFDPIFGYPDILQLSNNRHVDFVGLLVDNVWLYNGRHGGLAGEMRDAVLSRVQSIDNLDNGIYISGSYNIQVSDYMSIGNHSYGVAVKNGSEQVRINGFYISGTETDAGVSILDSDIISVSAGVITDTEKCVTANQSIRVLVDGVQCNAIRDYGVLLVNVQMFSVTDSRFSRSGNPAADYVGILVNAASDEGVIDGNTFEGPPSQAWRFDGVKRLVVGDNFVSQP